MRRGGFTLIELMVVLMLLGLLVGLSSKGLRAARLNARRTRALVEMKAIETAVKAYANKYGKPPAPNEAQGVRDYGVAEGETPAIILTLTAGDPDLNPAGIVFLEPQGDEPGEFLDPWGHAYVVALDGDRDGQVELAGQTAPRAVAVACLGWRELRGDDNPDDLILSWR